MTLFASADLRTIPDFAAKFPTPSFEGFGLLLSEGRLRLVVVDAAVLGMLGCIDALLTSVVADSLTRTEHDSNKELIGQGLANMASGLFGGLPGAGATMGTVVNIQSGGRSALSGVIRAMVLMLVVLLFAPVASTIPLAVLAGIAVKVGLDIIDWEFLKRAHHLSLKAAVITYGVILLTVLVDLIAAVGIVAWALGPWRRVLLEKLAAPLAALRRPVPPRVPAEVPSAAQTRYGRVSSERRVAAAEGGGDVMDID